MLEALLGIFSSSGIGAIVGLAGSWLTKREERRNLELQYSHEQSMYNLKSKLQQQASEFQLKMAEQGRQGIKEQKELDIELQNAKAFEASQLSNVPLSNGFAELIRGLMRPVITIYLLCLASIIALHIGAYVGGLHALKDQDLVVMYRDILDKVMFLTTTAVTWWFGSRPGNVRSVPATKIKK